MTRRTWRHLPLALVACLSAGLGSIAPAVAGAQEAPAEPAPQTCLLPDEQTDPDKQIYNGTDPSRSLQFFSAFRMAQYPCDFPDEFRTILLYPDAIVLLEAGQVVKEVPFTNFGRTFTLAEAITRIDEPEWARVGFGIAELDAAMIQMPGTSMVVSGAEMTELRLFNRVHAFVGGINATVLFEDVTVTSWDPSLNAPDPEPVDGRPFVLYGRGSHMDIVRSQMMWLGSDRSGGGYGISWQGGGSTGSSIESVFANNWFGGYTNDVVGIVFRDNVYRDNLGYGLDPHDRSVGLVIEGNESYGNGRHGIIVSNEVTDSVIRNNHVHHNRLNGIVLDKLSNRNEVSGNLVEHNGRDGIVALDSGDSIIRDNMIRFNRVGVRINLPHASNIVVEGNVIEDSESGIRVYGGAHDVVLRDNTVRRSDDTAISVDAPYTTIDRVIIEGAQTGIDIGTLTDVTDSSMSGVELGFALGESAIASIERVDVEASGVGMRAHRNADIDRDDVTLSAPTQFEYAGGVHGWRRYLPFVGAGALGAAFLLEFVRLIRQRGERSGTPPASVWNVS